MKKIIKIFVFIISLIMIAIIFFSVTGKLYPKEFSPNSQDKIISSWQSEKNDLGYCFTLDVYDDEVSVTVGDENYRTNGIYSLDELLECKYNSKIIFWDIECNPKGDFYASVVPKNCTKALIDNKDYYPQEEQIFIKGKEQKLNIIIANLPHKSTHTISLIDEKGNTYKEKDWNNPLD